MPLHDWTDRGGWDGVHLLWIAELFHWIKPRLPAAYRAYIGTVPTVAIGTPPDRPDVQVRQWSEESVPSPASEGNDAAAAEEPDVEIAVATLDPTAALYIESHGRLIAALELISPRNKDRPSSRAAYLSRYVGYLIKGVHLLLADLHPRPLGFSFADGIARELDMKQPESLSPPMAVSYRVGDPAATGGRFLGIWRRPLVISQALPVLPWALDMQTTVPVDLEQTYSRAAADMYMS